MKKTFLYIILIILSSCTKTDAGTDLSDYTDQGSEAARQFIRQSNGASEIQTIDLLLEVRAAHTILLQNAGTDAADAFEQGFEDYIKQHNDTLYNRLKITTSSTLP